MGFPTTIHILDGYNLATMRTKASVFVTAENT